MHLPVIAKLEKPQAIENLDEIMDAFDGFMVARGGLGVEMPLEQVPLVQKTIIRKARKWAKPVIIGHPDAGFDDQQSAPDPRRGLRCGQCRARRCRRRDAVRRDLGGCLPGDHRGDDGQYRLPPRARASPTSRRSSGILTPPAASLPWLPPPPGVQLGAKFLVAFTQSGDTARRMSRLRNDIPLLVFTPEAKTAQWLTLCWGAQVFPHPSYSSNEEMVTAVKPRAPACPRPSSGGRHPASQGLHRQIPPRLGRQSNPPSTLGCRPGLRLDAHCNDKHQQRHTSNCGNAKHYFQSLACTF